MNFINKALAQISELFRSMTPGARITAGMLLVVIVVSVTYLFNHQFSGSDAYLFGGEPIAPSELPAMQAAFNAKGLTDYEIQGTMIRVPRAKQAAYMGALADAGTLPHNFGDTIKKMIDNSSPFVPRRKQEEMMKYALQDELSKIISKMSGIETAMVLYDEQAQTGLNAKKLVTASVSVKPLGNQPLTATQVQMIRNLVAGAKVGLAAESISVVDLNGRSYPGGPPGSTTDASLDPYMTRKLNYEREFTENIQKAISFVSGAVVSVNVDLHPEIEDVTSSSKVDPKAVPIEVTENNKTSSSTASQPGGTPGIRSQGGVNQPAVVGSGINGSRTEDEQTMNHTRSMASQVNQQVRMAGLTPKRVSVSVAVPSNYYEEVWQAQNPAPAGQAAKKPEPAALTQIESDVRTKITNHVLAVLPLEDVTKDGPPQVVVTPFQSLTSPEIPKPSTTDHALVWFTQNAGTLGMGVLGIVSLLMVRSIVRSVPVSVTASNSEPTTTNEATLEEERDNDDEEAVATAPRLRRRSKSGPSLRDELVDIVREDPDAAANILRNWIGTAN